MQQQFTYPGQLLEWVKEELPEPCMVHCIALPCRGTFMQVQQLVQQVHPGMEVVGSNYPVTATRALAAQALVVAQMALLAVVFLGDQAFQALGIAPPAVYDKVKQNKFGAAMAVWFLGNMLHSSLTTTGAFEVFYNGQLVSDVGSGDVQTAGWGCFREAFGSGHADGCVLLGSCEHIACSCHNFE